MLACCKGELSKLDIRWKDETAICVVLSAKGYPGSCPTGMALSGFDAAEQDPAVKVFQAGTKPVSGGSVSSGGRVLGVTALGRDLTEARKHAYAAVDKVRFENSYCRRDIGEKGLKWEPKGK